MFSAFLGQKYGVWLLAALCVLTLADYVPCATHSPVNLTTPSGSVMTLGPYWNASLQTLQPDGTFWPNDTISLYVDSFGEYTPAQGNTSSLDNSLQMFTLTDGLCEIVVENDTLTVLDEALNTNVTLDRTSLIVRTKWTNTTFTASGRFSIFPGTTTITRKSMSGCLYNQTYGNNSIKVTMDFHNFEWLDTANTLKYELSSFIQTSGDHIGADSLMPVPFDDGCNGNAFKGVRLFSPNVVSTLALHQFYEYGFANGTTAASSTYYNKPSEAFDMYDFSSFPKNDIGIYVQQPGYQWVLYPGWQDLYYDPDMSILFIGSSSNSGPPMDTLPADNNGGLGQNVVPLPTPPANNNTVIIAVVCSIGGVAVIAGVIVGIVVWKKRRQHKTERSSMRDKIGALKASEERRTALGDDSTPSKPQILTAPTLQEDDKPTGRAWRKSQTPKPDFIDQK